MQQNNLRKIVAWLIVITVVVLLGIFLVNLSRPSIELTIQGPFDPTTEVVTVSGQRVFPSGKGGRTYTAKTWYGTKTVVISGPLVATQKMSVEAAPFNSTKKSITLQQQTAQDTFAKVTGQQAVIGKIRIFDNKFIIGTTPPDRDGEDQVYVLYFDPLSAQWKDKSQDFVQQLSQLNPPTSARNYYDELNEE